MQPASGPAVPFAAEKRAEAVRLAALGLGSRAGLARRSWEIAAMLDRHGARLDAIYRFPELMLREDGFAVLPPVVAETRRAFRLGRAGTSCRACGSDPEDPRAGAAGERGPRLARLAAPLLARGGAARFGVAPRDAQETARWRSLLAEGWAEGRRLAEDIFAADLDRLNRIFEGVVLWHRLRRAGMIGAPGIEVLEAGVSGHERLMRVRAAYVQIARAAGFVLDSARWAPPGGGGR